MRENAHGSWSRTRPCGAPDLPLLLLPIFASSLRPARNLQDYRGGKPYQMSGNPDVRVALGGPAEPSDESDDQEEEEDIQQLRQNFVGCTMQPSTRAWRL